MYQGKFDAKARGKGSPDEAIASILETRKAEQAKKAEQTRKAASKPVKKTAPAPEAERSAASIKVSADKPAQKAIAKQAAPEKPAKKASKTGTVIFYTLYFLFILLFFVGTFFVLQWLNGWLSDYEAAQPTIKCQEVFDELFAKPNWAELYHMANVEDTAYEGVDEYVSYMEQKVGDQKLSFVETSAGLSQGKKYIVRLGTEKIATFTLAGKVTENSKITDIPDWQLSKVELFFTRNEEFLIQKLDGHTAYVNGVPLDDSFTIQIATTVAQDYLPIGVSGVSTCVQHIDGLMAKPTVTVFGPTGEEMPVSYDEQTRTFTEQTAANTMTAEEEEVAMGALKSYAEFMINASGSRAAVNKYYDGSSQAYKDILAMAQELWMNSDRGHTFKEERLNGFAKYNDELFSVHGHLVMETTLKDGGKTDFTIDQSLFFRKKNGVWVCYDVTNQDITQPVGKVRLTFMNGNEELHSDFYKTDVTSLTTPVVATPEGKVFSGWVKEGVDESGSKTLTIVFTPDENGLVTLAPGTTLEPMVLYALFENAE